MHFLVRYGPRQIAFFKHEIRSNGALFLRTIDGLLWYGTLETSDPYRISKTILLNLILLKEPS
jgi:hypothetical protein